MAKAATNDRVSADMKPTDYRVAVKRLEGIAAKKAKQQGIAAEIGDIYEKVAALGVDKRAAKMFHAMSKMTPEDLVLVFRDLNGLLDASGMMSQGADLVDTAEDKVVKMRFRTSAQAADEAAGAGEGEQSDEEVVGNDFDEIADDGSHVPGDDFEEASDEELAQQQIRRQPEDGFDGDNSDLAPE